MIEKKIQNNMKYVEYAVIKSMFRGLEDLVLKLKDLIIMSKNKVETLQVLESTEIGLRIRISTSFQKGQDIKVASNKVL
ncbi:unnamed protein product [Rhizophagus irregularis]|nr:unnamed protein product [Rhizophagus irregularis]